MSLQICIITPKGILWNDQADEIILPGPYGQFGILQNHCRLFTGLDVGATYIRINSTWTSLAIMGGFAQVENNQVLVLAHDGEAAETIPLEQAENEFQEATKRLDIAEGGKERAEAMLAFKRARARYRVLKPLFN
jgi:F-type H+-transporting ATPase subunit epsilon